jgi:uncharacterized protein YciI
MNQYLYKLNLVSRLNSDDVWTNEDHIIISEHFNYLKGLTEEGIALLVGRTNREYEDGFGIVIFYAKDWEAAMSIMNGDPAIQKGIMQGTLYAYKIALESISNKEGGQI